MAAPVSYNTPLSVILTAASAIRNGSQSTDPNAGVDEYVSRITDTIYLTMQIGIEGGFAPSVVTHRWLITRAPKSDSLVLTYKEKPHGAPYLEDKVLRTIKLATIAPAIVRLQELLADLPVQYPGAPDLYGRNTSILHVTDYKKARDLDKYGAAAAEGVPQPTEEQKKKFDEAISIISSWSS